MWCPKCGTEMKKFPDEDYRGQFLWKCHTCAKIIYIEPTKPIPTTIARIYGSEVSAKSLRPSTNGFTAQQKATRRYRQSALFRQTNKRIQERYRRSEQGRQTLESRQRKRRILRKLEKVTRKESPLCAIHGLNIVVGDLLCTKCLAERGLI